MPSSSSRARAPRQRRAPRRAERGIVMIVTLIALVLLLIGVAATLRSVDTSAVLVGNLSFRRDLTNHAELAMAAARTAMVSGSLADQSKRANDLTAAHYLATAQANGESNGIPKILLSEKLYSAKFPDAPIVDNGVSVRYVIDRRCLNTGSFDPSTCESMRNAGDGGGSDFLRKPDGVARPVYRISVRVTGPRNTEAYFQTTYSD